MLGLDNGLEKDFFNDETKQFFKEHCDCGDFFEKQFKLEK